MNLMEDQQAPQSAEGEAKVITLCGSTKFEAEFAEVNQRLTMEGCVVISLGMFSLPNLPDYDWTTYSSDLRRRLGKLHFQKIRMADEVYVVDPGGYVGESIRRENASAESLGKPVRYLGRDLDCSLQRERSGDQQVAQQIALDQLHCNIKSAIDLSQLEDGHYVRVIQSRCRTGLPLKAFQILIIRRQVAGEEFDGNIAA